MGVSGLIMLGCVLLRGRFDCFSFLLAGHVLCFDEFLSYTEPLVEFDNSLKMQVNCENYEFTLYLQSDAASNMN
jgi:hypothetical protein